MKPFAWDDAKSQLIKKERGISFEEIIFHISNGDLLDRIVHPSGKYAHQHIFIVWADNYVYMVPFVEDAEKIFLKTIIPSRKYTRLYSHKKGGDS